MMRLMIVNNKAIFSTLAVLGMTIFLTLGLMSVAAAQDQAQGVYSSEKPAPIIAQTIEPEDDGLENVPDEYIEEALNFFDRCQAEPRFNRHYNCECLSATYLDRRIELGPSAGASSILLSIETKCADATEAAGYYYEQCLNNHSLVSLDIPIGEYCDCFANEYARIYESHELEPNSETFIAVQNRAMTACQNPELSRRIYQYVPKSRR